MLFTSLEFIFLFFPISIFIYYLLPNITIKNYWLMFISLFFYAWGEPSFLFVMLGSIVFNYSVALLIEKWRKLIASKILLAVSMVVNIGILFVYKYMNFVISTLHSVMPVISEYIPQSNFILPIGISFFTFQAMSYVIDVYRGTKAQKNLCYLTLYISFFPQLIAGPIVRYTTIEQQITNRKTTLEKVYIGMLRFMRGFNKKILLSNLLAVVADAAFNGTEISFAMAWIGILCYTLQIFFDFSGYSDMAIGLGLMFGFEFLENFNYPYISKTITEFWRRWHISLGSWFRDYVYFPLGGSRVNSKFKLVFNLSVVWLLTGIWHGASWNFILWGVLYGVLIIFEKIFNIPEYVKKHKYLAMMYRAFTILMVMFGWVLFRAANLPDAGIYFKSLFGISNDLIDSTAMFYIREYDVIITTGIVCSTPLISYIKTKLTNLNDKLSRIFDISSFVLQFVLFIVSISYLAINAHNPFIYFNF